MGEEVGNGCGRGWQDSTEPVNPRQAGHSTDPGQDKPKYISAEAERGSSGRRGECTSTQKGSCRKWELAGFIIELYNACDHLKGYYM